MAARGAFEEFGSGARSQALAYGCAAHKKRATPCKTGMRIWVRVNSSPPKELPIDTPLPAGLCSHNTPYVKSEKFLEASINEHGAYAVGPRPVEELAFLLKRRDQPELEKMVVDSGGESGWRDILYGTWGRSEKEEAELVLPLLKLAKEAAASEPPLQGLMLEAAEAGLAAAVAAEARAAKEGEAAKAAEAGAAKEGTEKQTGRVTGAASSRVV
jgi:hypothetical protein